MTDRFRPFENSFIHNSRFSISIFTWMMLHFKSTCVRKKLFSHFYWLERSFWRIFLDQNILCIVEKMPTLIHLLLKPSHFSLLLFSSVAAVFYHTRISLLWLIRFLFSLALSWKLLVMHIFINLSIFCSDEAKTSIFWLIFWWPI